MGLASHGGNITRITPSSDFGKVVDVESSSRIIVVDHTSMIASRLEEKVQSLKKAKTPHAVLELKENCTANQAKDMRRKLAKEWAPDRIGYQSETKIWELSNEIMSRINSAYDAISGKFPLAEWKRANCVANEAVV